MTCTRNAAAEVGSKMTVRGIRGGSSSFLEVKDGRVNYFLLQEFILVLLSGRCPDEPEVHYQRKLLKYLNTLEKGLH